MVGRAVMAVAAMVAEAMVVVVVVLMEAGAVVVMVAEVVVAAALDEGGVALAAGDVELGMCVATHCCRRSMWAHNTQYY